MDRPTPSTPLQTEEQPIVGSFPVRLFETIDASAWTRLETMLAANAEYRRPGYPPLRGAEEILTFYREKRIVREGRHSLSDMVVNDSHAFCHGVFEGFDRAGARLHAEFCDFYKFKNGRLVFRKTFFYAPLI